MTDIQAKIWFGYGKAASYLGQTFSQYRPTAAANPMSAENLIGTVKAAFDDSPNFKFARPNLYGHPEKFVLVDGSAVQPGDYLTGGVANDILPVEYGFNADGVTYFIADVPALLPIPAMQCNALIRILRPASNTGFGSQPYGGDAVASEVPVMTDWPAWIDAGPKGERGDVGLPGDIRMPWYRVLLPQLPGVAIHTGDIITDARGSRYKVGIAELSSLGWRLTAMLAQT